MSSIQKYSINFGKYSKGFHFAINGCQNVKFCDIVEFWKKFENSS